MKTATDETHQTTPTGERDSKVPLGPELIIALLCGSPSSGSSRHALAGLNRISIGRAADRVIQRSADELKLGLPDSRLSAQHAVVERVDGVWNLADAGSTNGSSVNGQKVSRAALGDGDVIEVGHSVLYFREAAVDYRRAPDELSSQLRVGIAGLATLNGAQALALTRLMKVAPSAVPMLLLGETGTGKEVLARAVHALSNRPGPFVAVNCGAIPDSLLESQLFGHLKGAFSGAVRDELGFVRSANFGTLFLDEIGDLPAASQAALLRVIQEGEVVPVGSARPVKVDVRVVSATHQPLQELMDRGDFRRDLYARLAGFVHSIPPLRERREDLGLIVASLLAAQPEPAERLRPEVGRALMRYDWPLNVRELQQCLTTASVLAEEGVVGLEDLPPCVAAAADPAWVPIGPSATLPPPPPLSEQDAALRRDLVARLKSSGGNVSQVARETNKARQQIQRWIRRFRIFPEEYKQS